MSVGTRPQPYRIEYSGDDPRMAEICVRLDEMLQILFEDLASVDANGGSGGSATLDAILTAIEALATAGIMVRTGSGTVATRTITAGAGISVTNGDGVSGNPTIAASLTPAIALTRVFLGC